MYVDWTLVSLHSSRCFHLKHHTNSDVSLESPSPQCHSILVWCEHHTSSHHITSVQNSWVLFHYILLINNYSCSFILMFLSWYCSFILVFLSWCWFLSQVLIQSVCVCVDDANAIHISHSSLFNLVCFVV